MSIANQFPNGNSACSLFENLSFKVCVKSVFRSLSLDVFATLIESVDQEPAKSKEDQTAEAEAI